MRIECGFRKTSLSIKLTNQLYLPNEKVVNIYPGIFIVAHTESPGHFPVPFYFHHLALSVKDPAKSVEFYKKVFQLQEITNRTKKEGIRWMSMGQDKELHFISIIKEPFIINKAIHLSLTTPRFDAFAKRLDSLHIAYSDWPGVAHTITKRADGISQLYLQDPDGYWVEVNNVGQ